MESSDISAGTDITGEDNQDQSLSIDISLDNSSGVFFSLNSFIFLDGLFMADTSGNMSESQIKKLKMELGKVIDVWDYNKEKLNVLDTNFTVIKLNIRK